MLDETREWRTFGVGGSDVVSGDYGSHSTSPFVLHARCADAETAEHIVRLHNEARTDRAATARLRPTYGTHGSSIG